MTTQTEQSSSQPRRRAGKGDEIVNTAQDEMKWALFNRFELQIPKQAVAACSHSGSCDEDVEFWQSRITRPEQCSADSLAKELLEYGTWDDEELRNDEKNWRRIVWIACGNINDER